MKVLSQFDSSIADALKTHVKSRATLKGHLNNYRFCDDVWFDHLTQDVCC
jgi:transcription initiation factor TFIIA small subunit